MIDSPAISGIVQNIREQTRSIQQYQHPQPKANYGRMSTSTALLHCCCMPLHVHLSSRVSSHCKRIHHHLIQPNTSFNTCRYFTSADYNKRSSRVESNITNQDITSKKKPLTNQEILHRLYSLSKPEQPLILASAATLAITSSISLLLPYACGHVLDAAILSKQAAESSSPDAFTNPLYISAGLFTLTCISGLGVALRTSLLTIAGNRIVRRIRHQLFASVLSQECAFMDTVKSGDLVSRLSNDAYFLKNILTTEIVAGLRAIVMSVGSTTFLFYTCPELAIISLASIPPVFLAARMVGRRLKKKQGKVQELHGKAVSVAEEVFGGFKTVQLFHAERIEYERYSAAVSAAHEEEISVGNTKAVLDGVVHVAAQGAVLLVLGYGGKLVLADQMTAGDLTGFLMYSLLMAGNISSLSGTYAEMVKSIAAAGRTFEIVPQIPSSFGGDQNSLVDDGDESAMTSDFITKTRDGLREAISISFQDIEFAYPTRPDVPVLGPFTLQIKAGDNVALVGGSGSGKSTVGVLLARLYNLESGSILINGHDIANVNPTFLRQQIGVVSQDPFLFDGTIADNIRYGKADATDEEVLEAARAAHVTNFTDELPFGLDTPVGNRGTQLSGGQRQRIAIARVMLKDPPCIVLDEATSALDARSEYHINQALKTMTKGRTVISIAHRLSTIKESDRIAMLKGGQVVEFGTFEELVEAKGPFHKLVVQQLHG